ncbi:glycoside hydrolase family 25 protein [Basidiobolus meristosporus CBS 931.73]|uniref:N,O-diacetylmuramidase n=1 Tax=Basidiobolus meristosporus CBS 931.73 TaxID=1314790 RepID=A0A1Y1X8L2_9FUNG|nr:glycoside hydrolase family 25 protein [Basidiobolus meristosporus CBS 931.73]|eukprot:ORX82093.1 glycoside hydrolase family 25 protein [Basidiobolus meristosporus CBS 931.73]
MLKITALLLLASATYCAQPEGIDVSDHQPNINWKAVKANGVEFAYVKATEGTTFKSPAFGSQYSGATNAGLVRGAYHFAHPDVSSGAAQANFFSANGGGWSADGRTLPGAVDLEYNPNKSGTRCYGLSTAAMTAWIRDFSDTYHAKTGRYPVIYTTTDWWKTCTGNASGFQNNNPLWIARWGPSVGELPAGYSFSTFWQYADSGRNPGDQDRFNGDSAGLTRLAKGS